MMLGMAAQEGSQWEALLYKVEPDRSDMASKYACSNCGYTRAYTFWWRKPQYECRQVNYCPGCGMHIMGVIGHD